MFRLLLLLILLIPPSVHASDWSYPLDRYPDRGSDKKFGQYFDINWYKGKEDQFPLKFTGFHTGVDLEIFPQELNIPVPVHAVTSGKVTFAGSISGYGGVILFRPQSEPVTFLYGHVKTTGVSVGQAYTSGQILAYLGDAFSSQTGGERKHLHFAVYRGSENYFKGYETTLERVKEKFYDPGSFFTTDLPSSTPASIPPLTYASAPPANISFWSGLINYIRSFLSRIFSFVFF